MRKASPRLVARFPQVEPYSRQARMEIGQRGTAKREVVLRLA